MGFRYCTLVLEPGGPMSGVGNSQPRGQGFMDTIVGGGMGGVAQARNKSIAIHGLPLAQADYVVQKIQGATKDASSSVFIVLQGVFTNPYSMITYCLNILGEMKYRVTTSSSTERYETIWTLRLDE